MYDTIYVLRGCICNLLGVSDSMYERSYIERSLTFKGFSN